MPIIRPALDIEANMADIHSLTLFSLYSSGGQLQSDLEQDLGILFPFMERC